MINARMPLRLRFDPVPLVVVDASKSRQDQGGYRVSISLKGK
jgi:hypothetical protein